MNKQYNKREAPLPSIEEIQNELKKGENLDDFFGREGRFAQVFARTVEEMLEGELSLSSTMRSRPSMPPSRCPRWRGSQDRALKSTTGDARWLGVSRPNRVQCL